MTPETQDDRYRFDLSSPQLEDDTGGPAPEPLLAAIDLVVIPCLHRDTVKMTRAEIQAAVEGVPDEDLVDFDLGPPSSRVA